ncbi:MAG: rod shape-determining protein MreC [Acidimicrobiales bacterium]
MAAPGRLNRRRFTIVLLVVTSVSLLTLDFRGFGPLESARSAVLGVLAPVGDFFGGIVSPIGNVFSGITDYDDLEARNRELQQRIDELEGQMASGQTAQAELDQLKASLGLTFANDLERVTARVTSLSISNYDDTIEIDRGPTPASVRTWRS